MAPKNARAKAKAAAAEAAARNVRKVGRRGLRRTALAALNTLAEEVGAARAQVDPKTASAEDVEFAIRVLDARCAEAPLSTRLRAAVEQWSANGGRLQAQLTPPPDLDTPAVLGRHKVAGGVHGEVEAGLRGRRGTDPKYHRRGSKAQ